MAYGIIKIIPASSHIDIALSGAGGGTSYPSVKVLNPNDGVVYIARNRDCLSAGYGDWDWKVPSQSYAMLPGPFSSVGAFYLDQSGAGRQGEFTIYPSQQKLDEPMFFAIGRALQAVTTSLDVTEGVVPANPASGILRLWADGSDVLHFLNGAGVDKQNIDALTALGGVLTGNLPNPGLAIGSALANLASHSITQTTLISFGAAISTTSAALTVAESVAYTPAVLCDLLLFYAGTFKNTLVGTLNQFQLAIDGGGGGYPLDVHEPVGGYAVPISIPMIFKNVTAAAHTLALYWGASGGTLTQGDNRYLIIIELRR